jgi:hypothetical protein
MALFSFQAEAKKFLKVIERQTMVPTYFKPHDGKQLAFYDAMMSSNINDALGGGARGGGKTFVVAIAVRDAGIKWGSGFTILIARYKYKDLKRTMDKCLQVWAGMGSLNKTSARFTFNNGAIVDFTHLQKDGMEKLQGGDYNWIVLEEITQIPNIDEDFFGKLYGSTRSEKGIPSKVIMTCNPGDVSHKFIKERYVDKGAGIEHAIKNRIAIFIPFRVEDNHTLMKNDPSYAENLKNLGGRLGQMWYHGDWEIQAGKAFDLRAKVIPHNETLKLWGNNFIVGIDWGYSPDPMIALFLRRIDNNQNMATSQWCVVREVVLYKTPPAKAAILVKQAIIEMGGGHMYTVVDPSTSQNKGTGSVRDDFFANGLPTKKANNSRLDGMVRVDDMISTSRIFFSDACPVTIKTISDLVLNESGVYDIAPHQQDHAYDTLRYAIMSLPRASLSMVA